MGGVAPIADMPRGSGLDHVCREITAAKQSQISKEEILQTLWGFLRHVKDPFGPCEYVSERLVRLPAVEAMFLRGHSSAVFSSPGYSGTSQ
ncbi:hypothetical protein EDC27_2586 [Desulfosoma caldarium]|uniref:Uncharacterized protein n=1 Tax=Desulfosoma caldarium TaxID=610254 RepID=A0A3N1UQ89_9BACT|nr:hypothetical protein EDC27_2586 [Desulfosoma caldarium]